MLTDLISTKEELLEQWCKQRGFFSSHDVNFYGTTHYYDSATRRVREWCNEIPPKVRKLNEDEKIFRGFKTKCSVYEWIQNI